MVCCWCINKGARLWESLYCGLQSIVKSILRILFVQVRGGQLWGTDIYTDDSDLVAGMVVVKRREYGVNVCFNIF